EDRVPEAAACDGIDGESVLFRHDLRVRKVLEGELREPKPRGEVEDDVAVTRVYDDQGEHALEAEVGDRRPGERDVPLVGRIERAAEEAGHSNSTKSPGLTPAARSSSSVASPRTR